ncbi:MAG: hypothetical protein Q9163_003823 [Psora crenata]
MADIDVESVLSQLTLEEKVELTAGKNFWHTASIPRLGVPSLRTSDGPNGVRGTRFFNGTPSACLPCATALGATFDKDLLRKAGRLLGQECKAKGAHILLGPTINIQRGPLGGRGFESFTEDPYLSGTLAGEYCLGVQEEDIITTPKHFVCNDQEHERMAVNSIVTHRALREIYLMPFMLALKRARPAAVMSSYNKVNGIHVAENTEIIDILRKEWGWEGLLMSDWYAPDFLYGTYSTADGINAGQDLEMPGPTIWRGKALIHAVTAKKVRQHTLDQRVRALLNTVKLAAKSGIVEDALEMPLDRPEDRDLLRKLAGESVVLLKNEKNVLPLDKAKTVAVIGPNAKFAAYSGGGSANLLPYYVVTPFEGISRQCNDVRFSQGAYGYRELPLLGEFLRAPDGRQGFYFRVYDKPPGNLDRKQLDHLHLINSYMFIMDYEVPNYESSIYYVDCEGIFTPAEDGLYDFGLTVQGTGQLFVDGQLIIDNATDQEAGTSFFGGGTVEEIGSIELKKGQDYSVKVEFGTAAAAAKFGAGGLRIGFSKRMDPEQAIQDAVKLASEVDQVVLFAGLNADWEGESFDRPGMDLPKYNDELITRVLAANENAVIFIQSGNPVPMPWAGQARALLHAGYGGNETGNGIADVLFGDVNPSAKLSLSFPHQLSDNPTYLNWGSARGRVLYGEDVYVGYRYYDTVGRPARFNFGHGLSYTTFGFSDLQVEREGGSLRVSVAVENTGKRAGAEVVQVYVSQEKPSVKRPVKELKGFERIYLEPGEKKVVDVEMELKYAVSFWDEGRDAWIMEEGKYSALVRECSPGDFLERSFELEKTSWWNGL